MTRTSVDVAQGVVALVAVTLGLIPLVQMLVTGASGSLWRFLPGAGLPPVGWVGPLVVVALGVAALAVLERRKR